MTHEMVRENHVYKEGTPIMFMMIGLPASGKSTIAARIKEEYNAEWCSSDTIRGELFGDESIQGNNDVVFDIMRERTEEALQNGRNVIYDATNLNSKKRRNLLQHNLKRFNCWKIAYVVLTDYKECRRRNNERKRVVPEKAMDSMLKRFTFPWWFEGWDEIIIEKTDDTNYLMQDLLIPLMDMPHECQYHNETIGQHLFDVAHSKRMNTPFLKNTALLHDIGKGFCKTFVTAEGEPSTDAHYYGHANVSAYMSLFVKDRLSWDKKAMRAVLIQNHMEQFFREEKGMKKLKNDLGLSMWDMLERLMEADKNPSIAWREGKE